MNPHDIGPRASIKGYDSLVDLALNLHSYWNHSTDAIWSRLDPELWELTHNPWAVLQTVSGEKFTALLSDQKFSTLINDLVKAREDALNSPTWFQENHSNSPLTCIAYFSMEFMLSEALPHLFGRPRKCSRRSAQNCKRSWRAGHRYWIALQPRLFPTIHR